MLKLKSILIVLGILLPLPLLANDRTAAMNGAGTQAEVSDLTEALRGSTWQGVYNALGIKHPMRIAFLTDLSADSQLQYFHKTFGRGLVPWVLGRFDSPCEFTPRALALHGPNSNSVIGGRISVYQCAANIDAELGLEASLNRIANATVTVKQIAMSSDGQSLLIKASVKGIPITYKLERQVPAIDYTDRFQLRNWVVSL